MSKTIRMITKLLPHLDSTSLRDLLRMTRQTVQDGRAVYLTELRSRCHVDPPKLAAAPTRASRGVVA